jgi:hypothetical protein
LATRQACIAVDESSDADIDMLAVDGEPGAGGPGAERYEQNLPTLPRSTWGIDLTTCSCRSQSSRA